MPWISVKDRRPPVGKPVITRFPGRKGIGSLFEAHDKWKGGYLSISYEDGTGKISHWWDGTYDLDLAKNSWLEHFHSDGI